MAMLLKPIMLMIRTAMINYDVGDDGNDVYDD